MYRHPFRRLAARAAPAALAALAAACTDRPAAPLPDGPGTGTASRAQATSVRLEALARLTARGLRNPALRALLKAQLDASPYREHKLQFQRFLAGDSGRARETIARESRLAASDVQSQADSAIPLELYLPVPAHRAAWQGDGRLLVATALADHDVPVAFDTAGNRYLLSPDVPPTTPVLALVPVETDFTPRPSLMMCYEDCGGGGGSYPPPPPPAPAPGLYMTQVHFVQTFESWLKGSPEFEVHILGQQGQTDSLVDYQCAGEKQPVPYYFDQNDLDWSGSVMLFSQAQLDDYKTKHPGKSLRVYALEDDDTACQIKTDGPTFLQALALVDSLYQKLTAGKDSVATWTFAPIMQRLFTCVASLINTNDDLIGNAVKDSIAAEYHAGYNWIVKGPQNVTNGWIRLEMK